MLDALTHCGQLLTVILHVAGCDEARIAGAFTMLLLAWGVLFYLRGFEHTSFLVAMIWRAISDMHGFFVFMVILAYFTAFSFYVLNGYPTYFNSAGGTPFMFFGEFDVKVFDSEEYYGTLYSFLKLLLVLHGGGIRRARHAEPAD